jgi:predicted dehydrogenase/threonine dehydrogenase-like Zn-dependent dehydrogenase
LAQYLVRRQANGGGGVKQLIQNYRSGNLKVSDIPAPSARAGGVVVATQNSLISAGTERATAQMARKNLVGKALERPELVRSVAAQVSSKGLMETMKMVFNRLDAPVAPGYSCAGFVLETGPEVRGIKVGDAVACAGQNYASHAEVVFVPRNLCVKMPDGVDFEAASYVALGAIAMQGIRQAEPRLGEVVAVIGLGLIGQLTIQMLIANGCTVVGADFDSGKLELARTVGASAVKPESLSDKVAGVSSGKGADAVIITASAKDDAPVTLGAQICRKRGRVVVVGAVGMNLPREPFYLKEIDFRLSTSYGPGRYDADYEEKGVDYPHAYVRWTEQRNMEAFLTLVQAGRVKTAELTTHRFPIERAEEAYHLIIENTEPYLGVILQYSRPSTARGTRIVALREFTRTASVDLGIIGAGNHVNDMLLPHLRQRRDVQIRAVCTGTGMKARALGEKLGAAFCTSDPDAVLADGKINAVLIATRHDSHASLIVKALHAGKHVFVEKPLCMKEEEIPEVLEAYAQGAAQGLRLMVGFNRRYSPHATEIRKFFDGRMNPLVMTYRVNAGAIAAKNWIQDFNVGGGRIIGEACHFVDFMQFVAGSLVTAVSAVSVGHQETGITNDQVIATLEFADGSIGTLVYASGGDRALTKERFEVFGNGRAAVLDDFKSTEKFAGGRRRTFRTSKQDKGFAREMAAFCDSIVSGEAPLPSIAEVESVTRACCLIDRSLTSRERYPVASA